MSKAFPLALLAGTALALSPAAAQSAGQSRSQSDGMSRYADPSAAEAVPLGEGVRSDSNADLQDTLYEIIYLKHATHQAHWNVQGPLFYSLHDLLGEIYGAFDPYIDQVAERKRALGAPADGRPGQVASGAELPATPEGLVSDAEVLRFLLGQYEPVSERLQERIQALGDDPVTQDLLIDVARKIEKDMWMIRSFQL